MRVIVYHGTYGCDTGCCGHIVEDTDGSRQEFTFDHPYRGDDVREWVEELVAKEFGEEHVADLDWANCLVDTSSRYCN